MVTTMETMLMCPSEENDAHYLCTYYLIVECPNAIVSVYFLVFGKQALHRESHKAECSEVAIQLLPASQHLSV